MAQLYGIYRYDWVYHEDILNQSENPQIKNRYVLVVSINPVKMMVKITSKYHRGYEAITDWKECGLVKPSYIKFDEKRLFITDSELGNYVGKLSIKDINKFKSKRLLEQMEKKKKKPAFGSFCTLNPDAGDVEKGIEIFNNSISNSNEGVTEAFLTEKEEPKEDWTVIYKQFEDILDQYFPSVEVINNKVEKLYNQHKGEEAWDTAYKKWIGNEPDEISESLKENIDSYVNLIPLEDIREGSIGNMDDDEIDFQERTFANIVRKLKARDSEIVALKYDDGYYDYNPDYLDNIKFETKTDRYGDLYSLNGMIFYKEEKYPFLYFRNEDEAEQYINLYNKEMEYEI